ncbi:MAG: plastocyanin/azurin family copper-binding protein [Gemmataceae bacterium]
MAGARTACWCGSAGRSIERSPRAAATAQAWNYRYGPGYGSPELASRHPGARRPRRLLEVSAAHVLADGRSVFLEMPELQPVNTLHLHLKPGDGPAVDLFATVHKLDAPFTGYAGYKKEEKIVAAHPILADLARATRSVPNRWRHALPGARPVQIEAGKNLTYATRRLTAKAGEAVRLTFVNPDVVPHNWVLVKPGALQRVGEMANRLVADPEAALNHYVPKTDAVLAHTDVTDPGSSFTIFFRAPAAKGVYPYLCTFPGHWMVMNGELVVE